MVVSLKNDTMYMKTKCDDIKEFRECVIVIEEKQARVLACLHKIAAL